MMGFRIVRGGYSARAAHDELEMIGGLARDLILLLGSDVEYEVRRRDQAQPESEDDLFMHFEAELADISDKVEREDGEPFSLPAGSYESEYVFRNDEEPNMVPDDALDRLLPDMSEDPEIAGELRDLTEASIAAAKIDHLVTFYQDVRAALEGSFNDTADARTEIAILRAELGAQAQVNPEAFGNVVWVDNDHAMAWLAALNDIRLVLAARLGVHDEESSDSVYERSTLFTSRNPDDGENLPEIETTEDMMVVLFGMLSWWQESLLSAVNNKRLRS